MPIGHHETAIDVEKKLAMHGSLLLMECLRDLKNCLAHTIPQSQEGITYGKLHNFYFF